MLTTFELPKFLFFNMNGSGLGHLSRCIAYARRLRGKGNIFFFSLASAMEHIEAMGFKGDYFISPFWSANTTYDWNCELAVRFGMTLESVQPDVVVFDGTWPFQGFLAACRAYSRPLKLVWSNRGLLKNDAKTCTADLSLFDLVIQPGELGMFFSQSLFAGIPKITVSPVTLLNDYELLPQETARKELGLRPNAKYALFSLGPGNLKDVSSVGYRLINLIGAAGFKAVWACNPITVQEFVLPEEVQSMSLYPLVQYMKAFDIFVGAAGYNTCCEIVQTQIPSLIVPNALLADDQTARAHLLAKHAPVVVNPCESDAQCQSAVQELLQLLHSTRHIEPLNLNGAELAAKAILELAGRE